ncbi:glycosyltransferase family 4 protein [Halobaculum sp. EA56]|uniref:glycosyltransferase family 4 protein n=1 Tax=Halobaculum sp. EA56 TaxID=3421648 RepID=UPI003EBF1154
MEKRIAILVKEFPPDVIGGTETQTERMARELGKRGYDVTVYTKSYGGSSNNAPEEYDVVRLWNLRWSPFVSTLTFVIAAFLVLVRHRKRYDVLQCMMIYPNGYIGYLVSILTSVPYLAWVRGGDFYFMKENPIKRFMISTVLSDTLVLVQTEQVKRDIRREFGSGVLEVVGNGVSIPDACADGEAITFVGRLKEQKGVHNLIRSLDGLDERLRVVGDGPERARLEELAASLDVDVRFVGEVPPDEVERYLLDAGVFVLPSVRGEGLPNAVLEAMAVGLPVIATDTGGVSDVIRDGENGYLVPPDDVEILRDRIESFQSPEKRRSMGASARTFVQQHYAWDSIVDQLGDVYERV